MCKKAVEKDLGSLWPAPDHFKTQYLCNKAVEKYSNLLGCVPDHFKTQ